VPVMPVPTAVGTGRPADPLSRPYRLPSRGIYYQRFVSGHDGTIYISPMRGEQEEIVTAAPDGAARQTAYRYVSEQCMDLRGIPFNELLTDDWAEAALHFGALSLGSDEVQLRAKHDTCGRTSEHVCALLSLPSVTLRLAEADEAPNWPPANGVDAAIDEIMRDFDGGEVSKSSERVLAADSAMEPFTTSPLPISGQRVSWRYMRMGDLAKAEEFATRYDEAQRNKANSTHTAQLAMQLVAIDGQRQSPLQALRWIKQQPTPVLNAWREEIALYSFGYDAAPKFRCQNCGGVMKVKLPLDGSIFRRRSRLHG
jgi:hypothetical protein